MAKRRRPPRKKQPPRHSKHTPSLALAVMQRLTQEGPQCFEENLIRLMQDSARLQQEPEFVDFHFDLERVLTTAAKQYARFKRRIEKGLKEQDQDAGAMAYDDYRIAAIRDLATPEFRQDLHRRLTECATRPHTGRNADLLEIAAFLKIALGSEDLDEETIPLGAYGLVTVIYEETFNRAMLKLPGARDIVGDELHTIWSGQHRQVDLNALNQAVSAAYTFAEFSNEIETEPDLAMPMMRQQEHLINELIRGIINEGIRFESPFFTPAEIRLSITKMESKHLRFWSPSRYLSPVAAFTFADCITDSLVEIMTSQRTDEAIKWWREMGQLCLTGNDKHKREFVPGVLATIQNLQSATVLSHNHILFAMYIADGYEIFADTENLSPLWVQTFERIKNTPIWKRILEGVV